MKPADVSRYAWIKTAERIRAATARRLMRLNFIGLKVFERQADIGKLRQTGFGTDRMGLL